jgi:hypothetical protein
VAYDLGSGDRVILAKGDLARAVRASMSIPVFFPPVSWEGRKLVDGLVVDNLPTDVAKMFGAAVTVAIDIGSPELAAEEYVTSFGVASQVSNLLSASRSKEFKADPDVYIHPDLGKHAATDYSQFDNLLKKGYEATRDALPLIREKLAAAGVIDLTPRPKRDPGLVLQGARIVEVVTRGNERASERLLRRTFNIPVGPGLRHGARPARFRQDRGERARRPLLDGVRAGSGRREDRAARGGRAAEPRGLRARLQRVGEGAAVAAAPQPEHARLRRAARAVVRGERRRERRPGVAARRPPVRRPGWAIAPRPTRSWTSRASSTRRAPSSTGRSSSARA